MKLFSVGYHGDMSDPAVDTHGGQVTDTHLRTAYRILPNRVLILNDILNLVAEVLLRLIGGRHHVRAGRALSGIKGEDLNQRLLQVLIIRLPGRHLPGRCPQFRKPCRRPGFPAAPDQIQPRCHPEQDGSG